MITVHAISPGARRNLPENWIKRDGENWVVWVPDTKDRFFCNGVEFLVRNDRLITKAEEHHHLQSKLEMTISDAIAYTASLRENGYITQEAATGLFLQLNDLKAGVKGLRKNQ